MSNAITLHDGRELKLDLNQINIVEYRALRDPEQPEDEGDELMGKVSGLKLQEVQELSYPDYRLLVEKFYEIAINPNPKKD